MSFNGTFHNPSVFPLGLRCFRNTDIRSRELSVSTPLFTFYIPNGLGLFTTRNVSIRVWRLFCDWPITILKTKYLDSESDDSYPTTDSLRFPCPLISYVTLYIGKKLTEIIIVITLFFHRFVLFVVFYSFGSEVIRSKY